MIAQDLQSISDWIAACAVRGKSIEPSHAAHLAKVLYDISIQVEALERMPIVLADVGVVTTHELAGEP